MRPDSEPNPSMRPLRHGPGGPGGGSSHPGGAGDRTPPADSGAGGPTPERGLERDLLDAVPLGVVVVESGAVSYLNAAALRLTGRPTREEALGADVLELLDSEHGGQIDGLLRRLEKGEEIREPPEIQIRRGRSIPTEVQVSGRQERLGGEDVLLLFLRDLGQQSRAERVLSAVNSRLEQILSNAPTATYAARPSGKFAVTYASPNAREVLGWEEDALTSDTSFWVRRIHPQDRDDVLTARRRLLQTEQLGIHYRFRRPDGRFVRLRDEACLVRDQWGEPLEIVGQWRVDEPSAEKGEEAPANVAV